MEIIGVQSLNLGAKRQQYCVIAIALALDVGYLQITGPYLGKIMSLMQLTSRFFELEKELHEAVRVNDDQRIRDADLQIELCFAELLECEPVNDSERQEKCAFLIERLCPAETRQGMDQLICEKILEIVSVDNSVKLKEATAK